MKALSVDVKERILKALDRGETVTATAKFFEVSRPTVHRIIRDFNNNNGLQSKRGRKKGQTYRINETRLIEIYTEIPDLYHAEAAKELECSVRAVGVALKRLGFSRKKRVFLQRKQS
jgi:transposase